MATITIQPPELAQYVGNLNEGNIDLVGSLCLEISKLRAEYGIQAAKLKKLELQQQAQENSLQETLAELRQLQRQLKGEKPHGQ